MRDLSEYLVTYRHGGRQYSAHVSAWCKAGAMIRVWEDIPDADILTCQIEDYLPPFAA